MPPHPHPSCPLTDAASLYAQVLFYGQSPLGLKGVQQQSAAMQAAMKVVVRLTNYAASQLHIAQLKSSSIGEALVGAISLQFPATIPSIECVLCTAASACMHA